MIKVQPSERCTGRDVFERFSKLRESLSAEQPFSQKIMTESGSWQNNTDAEAFPVTKLKRRVGIRLETQL
jgi:hypothetical protein